jgi:hypothetical protein
LLSAESALALSNASVKIGVLGDLSDIAIVTEWLLKVIWQQKTL